jgi:hypothetical protein
VLPEALMVDSVADAFATERLQADVPVAKSTI